MRLAPGKALFFRRGAQTFCREEPPAAVRVCASYPGKTYSTVKGRKLFAGKRRRRLCGFAPHTRESLILPLRGANLLPGKAPGGCESLRLIPGKALFHRRGAQTFCREEPPAAVGVCVPHPGKPYSTVEGRKLFAGKRRRQRCGFAPWSREFAPHTRESLILPLRGANLLPGRAAGGCESLRLIPGKALFFRRGAQTFCRGKAPAAEGVCAPHPGKPYSTVEGRKPVSREPARSWCTEPRKALIFCFRCTKS